MTGTRTLAAAVAAMMLAAPTAAQMTVEIHNTATDATLGSVTLQEETGGGVRFTPDLDGILPVGDHGFHAHLNPDCGSGGQAAGGHYDPANTGVHEGPEGNGHLGDLPRLTSDGGRVTAAVVAPRLTLNDIYGRALVIHEGGDNYSDSPSPLGGGGARLGCGVVATATPVMPPAALAALLALLLAIATQFRRRTAAVRDHG